MLITFGLKKNLKMLAAGLMLRLDSTTISKNKAVPTQKSHTLADLFLLLLLLVWV
jgi:hypothetical protein